MTGKLCCLLLAGSAMQLFAAELPKENRLMWNKHAAGFVETKFNRSTQLESVRTLKPARTFIKRIYPAYFSCGAWNIHSLPKGSDGSDHVPAGFNKLEKFEFKNPATSWVISNTHFLVSRRVEILPGSAIFKVDITWDSRQDTYLKSLSLFFQPDKSMTGVSVLKDGKVIPASSRDKHNFPDGETLVYTDESGKNGFAVFVDQSNYKGQPMGAALKLTSITLPGYNSRLIKKGEKIRLTAYFALFNDSDMLEAVKSARKKVFGEDDSAGTFRWSARPVVASGKKLADIDGVSLWRMAPELLASEGSVPAAKCGKWQISGAANEFVAEQLVATPGRELKNPQIKLSDFVRKDGKKLAAGTFSVEAVTGVPRYYPNNSVSVGGEYVDRLLRKMPEKLEKSRHYAFLISGRLPKKVLPGEYSGTVEITADGFACKLPLSINVYDFALPESPEFYADFLVSGSYADRFTKDKAAARKFCRADLVKLRLHPPISLNVFFDNKGNLTHDHYTVLKRLFKETGVQRFRIYGTFNCSKYAKMKPRSKEMDEAMANFARAAKKAFEPHGMLGNIIWQLGDECHIPDKLKTQIHYSKVTGEAAPGIKRFATINGFNPRIADLIRHSDIIAPHTDIFFSMIRGKMDLTGKEIWVYDNGFMNSGIRMSKVRGVAWKSWQYGITGYHQWSVNAWIKNWKPGDDYSGCIYYPPQENVDKNPQRSMRLVNFALTVSDYDYMAILNNEIKRLKDHPEGKKAAAEFQKIMIAAVPDCWDQTTDYSMLENGKRRIADLIVKLKQIAVK